MKHYLVGGAVRDRLLGLKVYERDHVVIGSTPEELVEHGFRQVGRGFPVFLHPQTHEEYALARKELKTGSGHTGFHCAFGPEVTLEQDLLRRDLTINAMAEDEQGRIIDPYGGQKDIEQRCLRHVSAAFSEDPLRLLRVARFASHLARFGFQIAPETLELMRTISQSGELETLTPERVWKETERALLSPNPSVYFQVLQCTDALKPLFPELAALIGVPQNPQWHPEVDTWLHTQMALEQSAVLNTSLAVRFAVLTHDLGKASTEDHLLPHHPGHGERGIPIINQLALRLRVPRDLREIAIKVAAWHISIHRLANTKDGTPTSEILHILNGLDGFRRPNRVHDVVLACRCDIRGRLGHEQAQYPQGQWLLDALQAASKVRAADLNNQSLDGTEIAHALHEARMHAIDQLSSTR